MKKKAHEFSKKDEHLSDAIKRGKIIRLISYAMSSYVEKLLDKIIDSILEKYKKENLKSIIYTCTKELIINGTKANIKRIFFEERNLNIKDENDYAKGMRKYKEEIKDDKLIEYGKKAKQKGLFVKISFLYNKDVLKIEVSNNTEITSQEEERLRKKFSEIMQYDDIMQYYMDHGDETEGSGIGLALIIILLLAEGINPNSFRIGIGNNITKARIEFPLSENYVCEREMEHVIRIND